jgi:hypothetical protein
MMLVPQRPALKALAAQRWAARARWGFRSACPGVGLGLALGIALGIALGTACAHGAGQGHGVHAEVRPAPLLVGLLPPSHQPVLVAHPHALFQVPATETLWRALVDPERERAFVQRTGVDPRTLTELVAREEGAGYLVLARGPLDAAQVVRAAGARLALPDVSTDTPHVRREGLAGQGRFAYAALGDDTVLVARDLPPQRVAQVIAAWEAAQSAPGAQRLPSVVSAQPAQGLMAELVGAPLVVLAPEPLGLPTNTPLGMLLAEQRALAAVARPSGTRVGLSIDVRGQFPEGAADNFRALGRSLSSTELMRLLGLEPMLHDLDVQSEPGRVVVRGEVEAADVVAGLRALFFTDTRALFE